MHNIDTVTIGMSIEKYKTDKSGYRELDYEHTYCIEEKIKSKLWLDKHSKEIQEAQRKWSKDDGTDYPNEMIYYHGICEGYVFNYNDSWYYLTIMLPHDKVETFDAETIIFECKMEIMDFFGLKEEDLNELVLNRLDIKCDFHYKDLEEFEIIKNIIAKAPDKIYSYKKRLLKNDDEGYILTYSATRKNNNLDELFEIGG